MMINIRKLFNFTTPLRQASQNKVYFLISLSVLSLLSGCFRENVAVAPIEEIKALSIKIIGNNISNDPRPSLQISGIGTESTIELYLDSCNGTTVNYTVTSSSEGEQTIRLDISAEGTYAYFVKDIEQDICTSTGATYTLDTSPPSFALQFASSTPSNIRTPILTINGTLDTGDSIEIFTDAICMDKPTQSISNGEITLTLTEDKTYTFYTKQSDQAGNETSCTTTGITYTLDTIAPSLSFQILTSSPSNITTPVLNTIGTIESGDVIEIFTDTICTDKPTQSISNGEITLTLAEDKTYTFYTKQSDQVGNETPCETTGITYTLDRTQNISFQLNSSSPSNSTNPVLTINGTLESGTTIRVFIDSACNNEPVQSMSNGQITITLTENKTYTFYTKQIHQGGNETPCATTGITYTLDTIAPNISFQLLTPSPSNIVSPVLNTIGTIESGDTIEIFTDAICTVKPTQSISNGEITLTLSENKTYTFYTKQSDQAGNEKTCATTSIAYTLDTIAPSLSFQLLTSSPSNSTTPVLNTIGTIESGDSIEIFTDAICTVKPTQSISNGEITLTLSESKTYTFYTKQSDQAGNEKTCATTDITYTLDTIAPNISFQLLTPSPSNIVSPVLNTMGTIEQGDIIEIFIDSSCTDKPIQSISNGEITLTLTEDKTYTFYTKQSDQLGNETSCASTGITYTLDATAPSLSFQILTSSPSNITTPVLSIIGTIESGDVIEIFTDSSCTDKPTQSISNEEITLTLTEDKTYTFYTKQSDQLGNETPCATTGITYTLDRTQNISFQLNPSSPSNSTNPVLTINGTLESGTTIRVFIDSACNNEPVQSMSNGQITLTLAENKTYTFYTKQIDQGGNETPCAITGITYTLDTIAPNISFQLATQSPSNIVSPVLNTMGTIEQGDTIEIFTDAVCTVKPTQSISNGEITLTLSESKTYTFYTKQSDQAGNESPCATTGITYTLDTIAPNISFQLATQSPSNIVSPVLNTMGTIEQGDTIEIFTDAVCTVKPTQSISNGEITLTLSENKTYTFYTKQIDQGGNETPCAITGITYTLDNSSKYFFSTPYLISIQYFKSCATYNRDFYRCQLYG